MITLPLAERSDLSAAVEAVRRVLRAHGVIALPTETFYGLAVDPYDAAAVERVFALKGRSTEQALPVLCGTMAQVEELVVVPERWRSALAEAWPAPLTVVLPLGRPLPAATATLAVRIPAHDLLRALLVEVGPLTGTSANRSGAPALDEPEAVRTAFGDGLALLLAGGRTAGGQASTIVDMACEPPRVLRSGPWAPPRSWAVKAP
jgi:L-threonylcarbamoyladenylate synthase